MKNYIFLAITSLFALFGLNSCLEDEGNYVYADMSGFRVDTVGIQTKFTVKQFAKFELTPKLEYPGNKSNLKYRWELYDSKSTYIGPSSYGTGFSHNYTRDDYPDYTIAETEQLSTQITVVPGTYYLVFTAEDPSTGVKAMMDYRLTVEGVVGTGLAVLYKGSAGTDIDMVSSPLFNGSLSETSFIRNTYSTANASRPFAGEPRELAYSSSYDLLYLSSSEDAVRLSTIDMSVADEFEDIFAGKAPAKKDMYGLRISLKNHFFINDGVACKVNNTGTKATPLILPGGKYKAVVGMFWDTGVNSIWYDALGRRFLHSPMWGAEVTTITCKKTTPFDFNNIGKDLIYWSNGYYSGQSYINYCLFKNPQDDGSRYLYVFRSNKTNPASYTPTCVFNIDVAACPDLLNATQFAAGERGPVFFYTTEDAVYRMTYDFSNKTSSANSVWIPDAGEKITRIELFKHKGISVPESTIDKYLLVATYNASTGKGKIHVIESDIANGVLGEELAVYEFNGKVADFDFID